LQKTPGGDLIMRAHGQTASRGNRVLRLILVNALFGAVLGLAFAIALILLNAQGLGQLLRGSDHGLVAFALLASGFMVTFGSVAAGTAIMQIGADSANGGGPRGRPASAPVLVPIPVRVRAWSPGRRNRH
jgi:hypothetical protein